MHNASVKQSRKREYETTTRIDRRSLWRVHVRREKVKDEERKGENNRLMSGVEHTKSIRCHWISDVGVKG